MCFKQAVWKPFLCNHVWIGGADCTGPCMLCPFSFGASCCSTDRSSAIQVPWLVVQGWQRFAALRNSLRSLRSMDLCEEARSNGHTFSLRPCTSFTDKAGIVMAEPLCITPALKHLVARFVLLTSRLCSG